MNTITFVLFYVRQSEEMRRWLEVREDGVEEFDDDILVSMYRNENGAKLYTVTVPDRNCIMTPLNRIKMQEVLCDEFSWTPEAAFAFAYSQGGQVFEITLLEDEMHFLFVQPMDARSHELKYRGKEWL